MKAVRESNNKNDWWGWNIKLEKSVNGYPNPQNIAEEAQLFYKLVVSGELILVLKSLMKVIPM